MNFLYYKHVELLILKSYYRKLLRVELIRFQFRRFHYELFVEHELVQLWMVFGLRKISDSSYIYRDDNCEVLTQRTQI